MGEPNAKRLLEENNKLKDEREELSNVLGEERDMVKYLHGVIKNYEYLLRSNSKKENNHTLRNMTDKKTVLTTTTSKVKLPVSQTVKDVEKKQKDIMKKDVPAGWRSLDLRHGVHGQQTVQKQITQYHDEANTDDDDVCLTDLESFSACSADELTEYYSLTPEMERGRFSDRSRLIPNQSQEKKKVDTSRIYEDTSRSRDLGNQKYPDCNHIDDYVGQHKKIHIKGNKKMTNDKETIKKKNKTQANVLSFSMGNRESSAPFDKEIDDLNKELDKITARLNKYGKSLCRSEKRLSKIEHRMEYLESFALGEESEYL